VNKRFLILGLLAAMLASAPAYADITIGLAGPLSGEYATLGEQIRNGAEQAVADINATGGIKGQKLVLHEGDDACDPKQAVAVANQMANAGVKFVVGHVCSGSSVPASKIYSEENILMVTPISTNPILTEAGLTNVFRTCGRDDQEGAAQARYVLKHLQDKKIGIVHDNTAVGLDLADQFKKHLNAGGVHEIVFDAYTPGEKDYSALVAKLKQSGVQVLVIGGYHVEVALITRQIKQQAVDIQVISDDALATPEFWSITGPMGEGVLFTFQPDVSQRPDAKKVADEMHKAGRDATGYSYNAYAAVQVIAEGIQRVGTDPAKVATALRQKPVKTIMGTLGFDAKGDVKGDTFAIYRWHNGTYMEVE